MLHDAPRQQHGGYLQGCCARSSPCILITNPRGGSCPCLSLQKRSLLEHFCSRGQKPSSKRLKQKWDTLICVSKNSGDQDRCYFGVTCFALNQPPWLGNAVLQLPAPPLQAGGQSAAPEAGEQRVGGSPEKSGVTTRHMIPCWVAKH